MNLEAAAAKALSAIIFVSTRGLDELRPQLPLQVIERGDSWLVKGTSYTDVRMQLQYCMCHVFLRKTSAEVLGIGCDGRQILNEQQKIYWAGIMSPEQMARIFGPRTYFEPEGIRDLIYAAYGGLINKPEDAVDYAYVLMQTKPALADIPKSGIHATERDAVWHVEAKMAARNDSVEVLSFSRRDGRVLSGDL